MLSNFAAVDLQAMPSLARGEARVQGVPCVIATPASLNGFGEIQFATNRAVGRITSPAGTLILPPQRRTGKLWTRAASMPMKRIIIPTGARSSAHAMARRSSRCLRGRATT